MPGFERFVRLWGPIRRLGRDEGCALRPSGEATAWPNRLFIRLVEKLAKMDPPDVVRTMNYRSGFFGGPCSALLQSVMRGPSEWTVGERELFAAYTSYLNRCPY
jgi:hypothetical protein